MTTGATGQLGLALPVQGELSGSWGNTVNNGITEYTNIAIAATLTLTNDGAVTLANTTGDASASYIVSTLTGAGTVTAQFAIVKVTGTLTTPKIITAPSYSKTYIVVNAATGSTVSFIRSGQTPAVSIAVGESAYVYYNGTDYVKLSSTVATGVTSFTAGTTGFTPSTSTTGAVTLAGTLGTANGGTNLTSFTSGGLVYASSTSALATGSALTFSGSSLGSTSAWSAGNGQIFTDATSGNLSGIVAKYSGSTKGYLYYDNSASLYTLYGDVGVSLAFYANNTEGMRLTSTGLGIGTSSPAYKLEVIQDQNAATYVRFRNNDAGSSAYAGILVNGYGNQWAMRMGSTAANSNALQFAVDPAGANTTVATLTTAGNVLVGGTAARGTTVGTAHLDLFNGTAPAGTLTNGISLYSDSGDFKFMNAAGQAFDVGYRNIPQNAQAGNYTLTLADSGDHIYHASGDGAATYTIPAASSVAFPLGTAITFINLSATSISIAITTDTMYLAKDGTTGTRTLAQYGSATAIKVSGVSSSGIWLISGSALT
jgi:hypothetical protein